MPGGHGAQQLDVLKVALLALSCLLLMTGRMHRDLKCSRWMRPATTMTCTSEVQRLRRRDCQHVAGTLLGIGSRYGSDMLTVVTFGGAGSIVPDRLSTMRSLRKNSACAPCPTIGAIATAVFPLPPCWSPAFAAVCVGWLINLGYGLLAWRDRIATTAAERW